MESITCLMDGASIFHMSSGDLSLPFEELSQRISEFAGDASQLELPHILPFFRILEVSQFRPELPQRLELSDCGCRFRTMYRENPFPGMNPWMQNEWSDVHTRLIGHIADALGDELPDDLLTRVEKNVTLSSPLEEDQRRQPDVAIVGSESWKRGEPPVWTPESDPRMADRVAVPVMVDIEEITPRWIEIRSNRGDIITVIEVTSPANKTRTGRDQFERKVSDFLQGGVSVMEIDLIRGGYAARDERQGDWPSEPCQVIVSRAHRARVNEVYPCPLREPLPVVRVPLRHGEPDAALDLQPLIDRCYRLGRYWNADYNEAPSPALTEDDLEWAQGRLREAGLLDGGP